MFFKPTDDYPVDMIDIITEIVHSRTAGTFMRDTVCFHCDSMNYESEFIESQWKLERFSAFAVVTWSV